MIIQNKTKWMSITLCMLLLLSGATQAREYHVSVTGDDTNKGTAKNPFQTISRAAKVARPGDFITVHEGTYRERINPPRGGQSDQKRIVYQAIPGEKVVIKGSEVIKGWRKVQNDTWKVAIPNSFFGDFNPYSDLINGDWFNPKGREHHTGAVYLNGHWLTEAAGPDDVLKPIGNTPLWFGRVDETNTTIWAQFGRVNPNEAEVEINVRQTVFYPDKTGINFITVRGFTMMHAATPWAPPTAEQIGLIGTHWSKGWIIENNDIRYSTCVGITLGKHGDKWDNTSANTAEGYVKTIERALEKGWSKENIGHHVVRNNHISHCEQAGIVGSLGPIFCTITGNVIHIEDVTEKRAREARLRRAESLAALTTLTAGVAHEIKNPLGSIGIHLELMKKEMSGKRQIETRKVMENLLIIKEEVDRLNRIVMDFLFTVRPMNAELIYDDLNRVVQELLELMKPELAEAGIILETDLMKPSPQILMDERYMKQAVLNLFNNAISAMPEGGKLRVRTVHRGSEVRLEIGDNGVGIPEENMDKIFEPYFTTKDFGSGLGLTLVYKIVKEHMGDIEINSKVGEGTALTLSFPVPQKEKRLIGYSEEVQ